MKQIILDYLRHNPGARKREIAGALGVWQCDREFLAAMTSLSNNGLITYKSYRDPALMEFYDRWYVAP